MSDLEPFYSDQFGVYPEGAHVPLLVGALSSGMFGLSVCLPINEGGDYSRAGKRIIEVGVPAVTLDGEYTATQFQTEVYKRACPKIGKCVLCPNNTAKLDIKNIQL